MEDYNNEFQYDYTYSMIIPHKNCPILLQRCLDSISYRKDVQVIVVDDNSDSSKVDFSHFPGLNTPNVEVYFTKEGKGAGYARNVGLKYARGKWLMFVDADDFLAIDFLEKIDTYANSNSDIVYFRLADESDLESIPQNLQSVIDVERGIVYNTLLGDEEYVKFYHNIPVGKIVRSYCVRKNGILFDEIPCANDVMFFVKLAFCVEKVDISLEYIYCVSKPTGRNLTSRKDYNTGKVRLQVLLERNDLLLKYGYKKLLIPPMVMLWDFRTIGLKGLLSYCWIIINSSTPLFLGISKFLKSPLTYLK